MPDLTALYLAVETYVNSLPQPWLVGGALAWAAAQTACVAWLGHRLRHRHH